MNKYNNYKGWENWLKFYQEKLYEIKQEKLKFQEVWPQKIVSGNFDEIKQVIESLGLEWKEKEVLDFVSPVLWSCGVRNG